VKALAKLGGDDERVIELLKDQLESERQWVRIAAVNALSETGDSTLVPLLLKQKSAETSRRATQAIDDAVKQLREVNTDEQKLRSRIEQLEKQQRELQRKLAVQEEEKS